MGQNVNKVEIGVQQGTTPRPITFVEYIDCK